MIGRIRGTLLTKQPPELLVEVAGVGYELQAPMSTFYQLPEIGTEVILFTHFNVREDAHQLFAFARASERALFRRLIKISGVGPKLALTLLSGMSPDQFIQCVIHQDAASLVRIPGVGKRTAERLLVEMKASITLLQDGSEQLSLPAQTQDISQQARHDAISALIALGYKPQQASRSVNEVYQETLTREELIKAALKAMTGEVVYA